MHPGSNNAAALVTLNSFVGAGSHGWHPAINGSLPSYANLIAEAVEQAGGILREAFPHAGAYANEADYFEPDWTSSFWGENYPRLLEIKRRVDPKGLLYCHHCVGSEEWSDDGMCRRKSYHRELGDLGSGHWRDPETLEVR